MSRRSIDSRMDRIMARLLPPGSMARREYGAASFAPMLDYHRAKTSCDNFPSEKIGGAGWYERLSKAIERAAHAT